MASLPTSRLWFLTPGGDVLDGPPREWMPALVEVDLSGGDWSEARLLVQGAPRDLSLRRLRGAMRVLAEWPRSGPGDYRLELSWPGGASTLSVRVLPHKIGQDAFATLLEDLDRRLPYSIAVGLERGGGLAGLRLPPPREMTLEAELERLRRAVLGGTAGPGLGQILPAVGRDPYSVLQRNEHWVRRGKARRPDPARLWSAFARVGNLEDGRPIQVLDGRIEPLFDVYENRLVRLFVESVQRRLRLLHAILEFSGHPAAREVAGLLASVKLARRHATFLDEVGLPDRAPDRLTMVLMRRPEYRQALEAFTRFRKALTVQVEEPALEAPLDGLPRLYQRWATLQVVEALLQVASRLNFRVSSHTLLRQHASGLFVRVLDADSPAVELVDSETGTRARLLVEPSYGSAGALRSLSFRQVPDVALEVFRAGGPPEVWILDPKYKLASEVGAGEEGTPTKVDIDKMHAYRDAVRTADGAAAVRFAGILYPGRTVRFTDGLQALRAYPGDSGLREELEALMERALTGN